MRPRNSSPALFVDLNTCAASLLVGSSQTQLAIPY